jgi:hypothetical protein
MAATRKISNQRNTDNPKQLNAQIGNKLKADAKGSQAGVKGTKAELARSYEKFQKKGGNLKEVQQDLKQVAGARAADKKAQGARAANEKQPFSLSGDVGKLKGDWHKQQANLTREKGEFKAASQKFQQPERTTPADDKSAAATLKKEAKDVSTARGWERDARGKYDNQIDSEIQRYGAKIGAKL